VATPDHALPNAPFQIGTLVATPGALALLAMHDRTPWPFLARHLAGDFGDLDQEDIEANRAEIAAYSRHGDPGRVLSRHTLRADRLWIITTFAPGSYNHTTILLPDEY
jgi:hypothetical protein